MWPLLDAWPIPNGIYDFSCRELRAFIPVLPELVPQHFAAIVFRQVSDHDNLFRYFSRGQAGLAVRDHRGGVQTAVWPRHHIAHDLFAINAIGYADRGGIEDARVLKQDLIDLDRRYVDAAANDEILAAPDHANEALCIPAREIAGCDALAADRLDCTVRAQIADGDVRSSGRDFA